MPKIFIVDDSNTARASIEYTLKHAGYETETAKTGEEAVIKLQETDAEDVGFIISDVNMPGMDGIEFVRQVRGMGGGFKHVPILVLTTESQQDMKMRGKEAGASGWLVKPFQPQQLIDVAKKFLG